MLQGAATSTDPQRNRPPQQCVRDPLLALSSEIARASGAARRSPSYRGCPPSNSTRSSLSSCFCDRGFRQTRIGWTGPPFSSTCALSSFWRSAQSSSRHSLWLQPPRSPGSTSPGRPRCPRHHRRPAMYRQFPCELAQNSRFLMSARCRSMPRTASTLEPDNAPKLARLQLFHAAEHFPRLLYLERVMPPLGGITLSDRCPASAPGTFLTWKHGLLPARTNADIHDGSPSPA